jgi:hypothetical protein
VVEKEVCEGEGGAGFGEVLCWAVLWGGGAEGDGVNWLSGSCDEGRGDGEGEVVEVKGGPGDSGDHVVVS